jgi:hypothetical protein
VKLHVSARNGHHQVSTPIKRILYICVGGVDVDISTHHPVYYCRMRIYNRKRHCRNVQWTWVYCWGLHKHWWQGLSLSYCHLSGRTPCVCGLGGCFLWGREKNRCVKTAAGLCNPQEYTHVHSTLRQYRFLLYISNPSYYRLDMLKTVVKWMCTEVAGGRQNHRLITVLRAGLLQNSLLSCNPARQLYRICVS